MLRRLQKMISELQNMFIKKFKFDIGIIRAILILVVGLLLCGCSKNNTEAVDQKTEAIEPDSITENENHETADVEPVMKVISDSEVSEQESDETKVSDNSANVSDNSAIVSDNSSEEANEDKVSDTSADTSADNSDDTSEVADNTSAESDDGVDKSSGFYITDITDDIKNRITGISYPSSGNVQISYDELAYVHVKYFNFNNQSVDGELICNKKISGDLLDIFSKLYSAGYQIDKIKLIDEYMGDDDASCADDNTSSFNYRATTGGKKLSKHAYGTAIDINPFFNPYVTFKNGEPSVLLDATRAYIDRSQDFPHKIDYNDLCYQLFIQHGFKWGGDWKSVKDYQHFEKDI